MPIRSEPHWYEGDGKAAHLLMPGQSNNKYAWCNAYIDVAHPAPYRTRCKSCMSAVAYYYTEASVEPPKRVRTRLIITIEHNADESSADVLKTANRRVVGPGQNPTWRVHTATTEPPVAVNP